jgi:hypothetical protein
VKGSIRRIVATYTNQYLGEGKSDQSGDWMSYMMDANEPAPGVEETVKNLGSMSKGKAVTTDNRGGGDAQVGQNLMNNVPDPMSLNKIQGNPPANHNDEERTESSIFQYPIELNKFERSDDPSQSLQNWWTSRRRDDDSTGNPWGSDLTGEGTNVSNREASYRTARIKLAYKNIHEVIDSSHHQKTEEFKGRGKLLTPTLTNSPEEQKKGIYTFDVKSEEGDNTVKMQFLKAEGPASNLVDHPVLLACDCPSFLYWGPQYYAVEGSYMYMPLYRPQTTAPKSTIQGGNGQGLTFCKHIYSVVTHLTALGIDKEYSEDTAKDLIGISDVEVIDPSKLDLEEKTRELHLSVLEDFARFVNDDGAHREAYDETKANLEKNGVSEHQLVDFVTGLFVNMDRASQLNMVNSMNKSPDTMLMILFEYRKHFGKVPRYLIQATFNMIRSDYGI